MSFEWMIENEELMMFVIVPALMIPVGWVVTKILKIYENQLRYPLTNADDYGIIKKRKRKEKMVKRNYHRLNYDPWAWKPIAPETAEEKADRKRREAIAAEKRAKRKIN